MTLSDAKKRELRDKYNRESLFLEGYDYSAWSKNKRESTDKVEFEDLSVILSLEGDEDEVKKGQRIKILTSNKLLTRLPIILAQIKVATIHAN